MITVPTYNDSSRVETMVEKLTRELKNLNDVRILVADDGSTDQTFEILFFLPSYDGILRTKRN